MAARPQHPIRQAALHPAPPDSAPVLWFHPWNWSIRGPSQRRKREEAESRLEQRRERQRPTPLRVATVLAAAWAAMGRAMVVAAVEAAVVATAASAPTASVLRTQNTESPGLRRQAASAVQRKRGRADNGRADRTTGGHKGSHRRCPAALGLKGRLTGCCAASQRSLQCMLGRQPKAHAPLLASIAWTKHEGGERRGRCHRAKMRPCHDLLLCLHSEECKRPAECCTHQGPSGCWGPSPFSNRSSSPHVLGCCQLREGSGMPDWRWEKKNIYICIWCRHYASINKWFSGSLIHWNLGGEEGKV